MIDLQDLKKSYGAIEALRGISTRIERGEIVGDERRRRRRLVLAAVPGVPALAGIRRWLLFHPGKAIATSLFTTGEQSVAGERYDDGDASRVHPRG